MPPLEYAGLFVEAAFFLRMVNQPESSPTFYLIVEAERPDCRTALQARPLILLLSQEAS